MIEVLYVAAEDDAARIKERFAVIGGGPPPHNLKVMLADQFRALAAQYSEQVSLVDFFDGYLSAHPSTKMLILDTEATCRAIWDGEAGRAKDIKARDYGETRDFDRIALKHRAFVGLVNHTSKRRNGGYLDLHELVNRTNVALAGASGSIVLADPPDRQVGDDEDKRRVLGIRGRDIRDDIMLAVEQQEDASFRSLGYWTAVAATQAEQDILEAALDINGDTPGQWIASRALADAVGKSPGAVKRAITRMMRAARTTWKGYQIETRASRGLRLTRIGETAE